jgi:hypothetical protein
LTALEGSLFYEPSALRQMFNFAPNDGSKVFGRMRALLGYLRARI